MQQLVETEQNNTEVPPVCGERSEAAGLDAQDAQRHPPIPATCDTIVLEPYDPTWPRRFIEASDHLRSVLAALHPAIEHIGSTAVTGLAAKPVIDILLGVENLRLADEHVRALHGLGYEYRPDAEAQQPERRFFVRRHEGSRTHHLHCVRLGSRAWYDHLLFRDRLRHSSSLRRGYEALKYELALRHAGDRVAYTYGKTRFIAAALAEHRRPRPKR